jgi:hypothetical protein
MKGNGSTGSKKSRIAKTATEALNILWELGFFKTWKKKSPIVESLGKRGNHFSDPELGMALLRARQLTRRGKRGAYEYIQKYPFVAEQETKLNSIKRLKR